MNTRRCWRRQSGVSGDDFVRLVSHPSLRRSGFVLVTVCLVLSCSQQEVERWNQFWAASQPTSQPASQPATAPDGVTTEPAGVMDEVSLLRLQRDRLLAANRRLQQDLDAVRQRERELTQRSADLERRLEQQSADLESRRRQLRQTMDSLQESRDEWEATLADRQRQIDILTNKVERVERELEKGRQGTPASGGSRRDSP
jgi:septal ring factor EnvC (AmiA/AmiB activator)